MASPTEDSRLMALPGEIRNRIYRFVFADSPFPVVFVTSAGLQEPKLLTTCKEVSKHASGPPIPAADSQPSQVRKEAGPIFWVETVHTLVVDDFDGTSTCRFTNKSRAPCREFGLRESDLKHQFVGITRPNWANLMDWAWRFHSSQTRVAWEANENFMVFSPPATLQKVMCIASTMFQTTHAMRDKPWAMVERLLLGYRRILKGAQEGWMVA